MIYLAQRDAVFLSSEVTSSKRSCYTACVVGNMRGKQGGCRELEHLRLWAAEPDKCSARMREEMEAGGDK
jgi:hypothetical protein